MQNQYYVLCVGLLLLGTSVRALITGRIGGDKYTPGFGRKMQPIRYWFTVIVFLIVGLAVSAYPFLPFAKK